MLYQYKINTHQADQFIDLATYIQDVIDQSKIRNGVITLFCPHTTAGLTINENADPDVVRDMRVALDKTFPLKGDYKHFEGNSHAHLKASFVGANEVVIINDGKAILGTWQSVYFCEFDGPRLRTLYLKVQVDHE